MRWRPEGLTSAWAWPGTNSFPSAPTLTPPRAISGNPEGSKASGVRVRRYRSWEAL